jgi:hypothetical protein
MCERWSDHIGTQPFTIGFGDHISDNNTFILVWHSPCGSNIIHDGGTVIG